MASKRRRTAVYIYCAVILVKAGVSINPTRMFLECQRMPGKTSILNSKKTASLNSTHWVVGPES